jgi:uncharacterized DUF497 family protein
MRIDLPDHAKCRLLERNIDISNIKKVINSPQKAESVWDDRLKKKSKLDNGKVLEVVYKKITKNKVIIITAYYED